MAEELQSLGISGAMLRGRALFGSIFGDKFFGCVFEGRFFAILVPTGSPKSSKGSPFNVILVHFLIVFLMFLCPFWGPHGSIFVQKSLVVQFLGAKWSLGAIHDPK